MQINGKTRSYNRETVNVICASVSFSGQQKDAMDIEENLSNRCSCSFFLLYHTTINQYSCAHNTLFE